MPPASDDPVGSGTLLDLLAGADEATALRSPEPGSGLSYGELRAGVDRLAAALAGLGVEQGDRVALALPGGPEFVPLLLGTASLGAAAAPLNPAYTAAEFAFYLDDLRPRILLLPSGELAAAREAAGSAVRVVDVALGSGPLPDLGTEPSGGAERASASADDVALLLHTSGTTGRPKQVPLRHRNLLASARSMARHYGLSAADVSYALMPLFHVHGLVASALAQLAAGGTVVAPRRVAPGRFWAELVEHGVTWYSGSPTFHQMLLDRAPKRLPAGARLRFARSCSSALSAELHERAEALLEVPVLEAYGMTEASHEMAANPLPPGRRVPGSVGIATGAEVRIVDSSGAPVAGGEAGEVVVRGPGVMDGYLGDREANAKSFYGEWFRTGDQGTLADGYLRLVGRIKEIIIRGGENISPLEVEDVLLRHPAVGEAVVYGIPDAKYGQVVGAAVVARDQADADALLAHCREHLAAFKIPTVVHVVDAIPRTPTGKVQRPRMASHFGEA
jgi:acyl-CoA synthetase (AMP-forming)/AMP-acid ligase II